MLGMTGPNNNFKKISFDLYDDNDVPLPAKSSQSSQQPQTAQEVPVTGQRMSIANRPADMPFIGPSIQSFGEYATE